MTTVNQSYVAIIQAIIQSTLGDIDKLARANLPMGFATITIWPGRIVGTIHAAQPDIQVQDDSLTGCVVKLRAALEERLRARGDVTGRIGAENA